jgi:hypothetical protein
MLEDVVAVILEDVDAAEAGVIPGVVDATEAEEGEIAGGGDKRDKCSAYNCFKLLVLLTWSSAFNLCFGLSFLFEVGLKHVRSGGTTVFGRPDKMVERRFGEGASICGRVGCFEGKKRNYTYELYIGVLIINTLDYLIRCCIFILNALTLLYVNTFL